MLINAYTAIAPAGFGATPAQGSAVPAPGAPWTGLPGTAVPCGDRRPQAATGGAMRAVAFGQPAVVASRVARLRAVQHAIDLTTPNGTTLGNHSPGRPQS